MKKSIYILIISLFYIVQTASAGKYFWVGNGGNWMDLSHWATISGGSLHPAMAPGFNDTIYFDANSFDSIGTVHLDTLVGEIAMMDWSGVDTTVEFVSGTSATLIIHGNCILSSKLAFNFHGLLKIAAPVNVIARLDFKEMILSCDVELSSDSVVLLSRLYLPSNQLSVTDGSFNTNHHYVTCLFFNTDSTLQNSIPVTNPRWFSSDTLTVRGSLAIADSFDFRQNGPVFFNFYLSDTNFINMYGNTIPGKVVIDGNKKMFLRSQLSTNDSLKFTGGGIFYSKGYSLTASAFSSNTSLNRTIDLDTSTLTIFGPKNSLYLQKQGLTLISDSAKLFFTYTGVDTVGIITGNTSPYSFKEVHLPPANVMIYNSINTSLLSLDTSSVIALAKGITLNVKKMTITGDCGHYIYIKSFCPACPVCEDQTACDTTRPVFHSDSAITVSYLKLQNIKAEGPGFTADNSFDEGNNSGWIINEPTTPADIYWVGGSGNWNDPKHWSVNSGTYIPGSCLPTRETNVVFDDNSFSADDTITVDNYAYCSRMTWTNSSNNGTVKGKSKILIAGDISLSSKSHFLLSGGLLLKSLNPGSFNIECNSADIACDLEITGNEIWNLTDTLTLKGKVMLEGGTLNLNNFKLHCNAFISGGDQLRTLDYSNSIIYLNGIDTAWRTTGSNLTLTHSAGSVRLISTDSKFMLVDAGENTFDTLDILCPKARIANGINCKLIKINPGTLLECEPLKIINFDSIAAQGSCDKTITISCYSNSSDSAFFKINDTNTIINVDNVVISNVCAINDTGRFYNATHSIGLNSFSGWNITGPASGTKYYWTGMNSTSWHELGNWKVDTLVPSCLPGPMDTVMFDSIHLSAPGSHDTVIIETNAYCRTMIWDSTILVKPALLLGSDLIATGSVVLCDSLRVVYTDKYKPADADAPSFILMPQNAKSDFEPGCKQFAVNISIQGLGISDSVCLFDNLTMDTLNTITFLTGTFTSNEKSLYAGIIASAGNTKKSVSLNKCNITSNYIFSMQDNSLLNLNMDSSILVMDDNKFHYNLFEGGGHRYGSIEFKSMPTSYSQVKNRADILSSDTIHLLKINPGLHVKFKSGTTQTLDSIIAHGKCNDSIYFQTSNPGSIASLVKHTGDSIRGICLNVKDITATNGASAIFSKNIGNNSGWFFSSKKLATSSFNLPPTTCINDSVHFINTSTALSGNINDLSFTWYLGDNDTSLLFQPVHLYSNNSSYSVYLISTETATGCSDVYNDSVTIYKPDVYLNTTESDLTICLGDTVTFHAFSSNPSPSFQFMVAGDSVIQPPDSIYKTNGLANGDNIYVILSYHGCVDTSNQYMFTVHSLPAVSLASSDTAICFADTLNLMGNGADKYQLYLDDSIFGSFGTNNQWKIDTLTNGDKLTLFGLNTTTGCSAKSSDTLTVTVYPLPVVGLSSSDPDTSICSGDPVVFTASNASLFQFFLDGDTLGSTSAMNTLTLSTLTNGSVVSVAGISAVGCIAYGSDFLEFTVMPTPIVGLSGSDPDNIICKGDLVIFQASGADQYQFSIDSDTLDPFDYNNSFSTNSLTDGQTITVEGKLGTCKAQSGNAIVMDVRPLIQWTWSDNEICSYDTIHFTAHGDSLFRYYINGIPVTPLGPDSIFTAINLIDGQQVSVGGTAGACTPPALTVTVHPIPLAHMSCSEPDTAICQGEAVTFTGSGAAEYAFYINGMQTAPFSTTNTFTTNTLTNGQTVTMEAISAYGCLGLSPDIYTMTVKPYPVVTFTQSDPDLTICAGDTVTFNSGGAINYEFFINGASQGLPGPVITFSSSSLVNGAVVTVEGTTGFCSSMSATAFTFTVKPLPIVTLSALTPLSYCIGDTLRLLAGGGTSYEFFINGISSGPPSGNSVFSSNSLATGQTVSVAGFLAGCSSEGNSVFTVTVNNYPVVNLTADQPTTDICYGDSVVFLGTGALEYIFFLDNNPVSYDSVFITGGLEDGQIITLLGGNGACWTDADTALNMHVNYIPMHLSCSPSSTAICEGDAVTFTASGADLYEFFIDNISQGSPSASGTFSTATLTDGQMISVEGTSLGNGCVQDAFSTILIHVFPVPQITVTPAAVFCEGDSALLESSVSQGLTWYQDGGVIAGVSDASLYVLETGNYSVSSSSGGNGTAFSAGANYFGQLGDGTLSNSLDFKEAQGLSDVNEIACGAEFTLSLMNDGSVRSWGRNEFGALGNGSFTDSSVPVSAGSISNATHVAAGYRFGIALLEDSTLLSWGENTYGQLGYGNYATSNFPFAVSGLSHVVDVAAGDNHCLAVTADGHVWAWGRNLYGQLGDSTLTTRNMPVQVHGIDHAIAVRAGGNHSMALKNDHSLWVWGANNAGQLGNGNYAGSMVPVKVHLPLPVASFDGGSSHSIAADSAGHVYTWGDNTYGQIGDHTFATAVYPVKIAEAGEARQVRAGQYSSYAIRSDDNVFSWGANINGQLGQQNTNVVNQPEAVTSMFGVVSMDAGNFHCGMVTNQVHSCTSASAAIQVDTVPPVVVYLSGLTLFTTTQGVHYQWYYEGSMVTGANDSSISLAAEGVYSVLVTFANGCSRLSDGFSFYIGLQEITQTEIFSVYPNPNTGKFFINFKAGLPELKDLIQIRITDKLGRNVFDLSTDGYPDVIPVDLPEISNGIYTLEIRLSDGRAYRIPVVIVD